MTWQEEKERNHVVGREIAAALGKPWRYAEDRDADGELMNWAPIVHPQGWRLAVAVSPYGQRGRVVIDGSVSDPEHPSRPLNIYPYVRKASPTITVAETRPAVEVAKEISRRLLPAYERWHAEVKAAYDSDQAYKQGTRAVREQMAAICDGSLPEYNERDVWCRWDGVSIERCSPSNVRLVFDIAPERAAAVLKFYGKLREAK